MTPSPKDRQNSGVSMLELEQVVDHLTKALNSIRLFTINTMKPVEWELRTALAILGVEEEPWCEHCKCHHVDRGPWIGGHQDD